MLVRERFETEYAPIWALGYGSTIWSPLASGVLSGKYNNGIPKGSRLEMKDYGWLKEKLITTEAITFVKKLEPIAKDLGASLAQFGLAWCLKNPHVSTVITGASRVSQVHENLRALDVMAQLDAPIMERIDQAASAR
jgi:aryl-alcohol dehydrogenase-like predicted oxidoreductase